MKHLILVATLVVMTCFSSFAFTGNGSGTEKDPYQVTNADELFEVRNDLAAHYIQLNEIDLTEWIKEDNPKQGWNPIGDSSFPFTGSYNGDGKEIRGLFINRPNSDNVGLFGCVVRGKISNLNLKNSSILGKYYVGVIGSITNGSLLDCKIVDLSLEGNSYIGLVGQLVESVLNGCETVYYNIKGNVYVATLSGYCQQSSINDNIAVLGNIEGNDYISGGVADYWKGIQDYSRSKNEESTIVNNSIQTNIVAEKTCTGIVGIYSYNEGTYEKNCYDNLTITDNLFDGTMMSTIAQGIGGNRGYWKNQNNLYCYGQNQRNIVTGSIYGKECVDGIARSSDKKNMLNNICAADTISVASGGICRISPNTTQNNYASAATTLLQNGKPIDLEDGYVNGISYGLKTLKKQSTYEGLGFDFNNHWAIVEGETLPYNIRQSKPTTITEFVSGGKSYISGTAEGTGKVYVKIGQTLHESYVLDGKWEVSLGSVKPGAVALVSVETDGKAPSIVVKAYADRSSTGDKDYKAGDANGDSVIDAADVVSIINYIIGKSSSSFNALNADVNGDGQVLVDDAVATVELIMNAQ